MPLQCLHYMHEERMSTMDLGGGGEYCTIHRITQRGKSMEREREVTHDARGVKMGRSIKQK